MRLNRREQAIMKSKNETHVMKCLRSNFFGKLISKELSQIQQTHAQLNTSRLIEAQRAVIA